MNIYTEKIPLTDIPLQHLSDTSKMCFFDIETTGLSADISSLYLIGALVFKEDSAILTQWFCDDYDSEKMVLESFFDFVKEYPVLVHFNGKTFDVPYVSKKAKKYNLDNPLENKEQIDIYQKFRPFKSLFHLKHCTQKDIELLFSIQRNDTFSGKECITLYSNFLQSKIINEKEDTSLLNKILLHNRDDIFYMLHVSIALTYPMLFSDTLDFTSISYENTDTHITFHAVLPFSLPVPFRLNEPEFVLEAAGTSLHLQLPYYYGTLKHFYKDYKNYFYLPEEDTAIHKNVACYVDAAYKKKATASTCYTKKEGNFIPCPDISFEPVFKTDFKDSKQFFLPSKDFFDNETLQKNYLSKYLHLLKFPVH